MIKISSLPSANAGEKSSKKCTINCDLHIHLIYLMVALYFINLKAEHSNAFAEMEPPHIFIRTKFTFLVQE